MTGEVLQQRARIVLDVPVKDGVNNRIDFQFRTRPFSAYVVNNQLASNRLFLGWTVRNGTTGALLGWVQQDDTEMESDWIVVSPDEIGRAETLQLVLESDRPVYVDSEVAIIARSVALDEPLPYRFCLNVAFGAPNDEVFVGDNVSYREGEQPTGNWFQNKFFRWCKNGFTVRLPTVGAGAMRIRIHGFFASNFRVVERGVVLGDFVKSHTHDLRSEAVYEVAVSFCAGLDEIELEFVSLEDIPGEQMDLRQLFAALHRLRVDYFGGSGEPLPLGELLGERPHWSDISIRLQDVILSRPSKSGVGGVAIVVSPLIRELLNVHVDTASLSLMGLLGAALCFRQSGLQVEFVSVEAAAERDWDIIVVPRQSWADGQIDHLLNSLTPKTVPVVLECQYDGAMFSPIMTGFTGASWRTDGCTFYADALMMRGAAGVSLVGEVWVDFLTLCEPATGEVLMYGEGTRYPAALRQLRGGGITFTINGAWFANYWSYGLVVYREAIFTLLTDSDWHPKIRLSGDDNVAMRLMPVDEDVMNLHLTFHGTGLLPVGTGIGRGFACSDEGLNKPRSWPISIFWRSDSEIEARSLSMGGLSVKRVGAGIEISHPGVDNTDIIEIALKTGTV